MVRCLMVALVVGWASALLRSAPSMGPIGFIKRKLGGGSKGKILTSSPKGPTIPWSLVHI